MITKTKVFVFGIDGASWNILDKIIEKGWMPCLSSLVERCGKAILESSVPPTTYPAWINFSTGANPGKHGIYAFWRNSSYDDVELVSGDEKKVKPFYSYLDQVALRCILVNLPGAFPLDLKHGKGLGSFLDRGRLYYPGRLSAQVPEVKYYKSFPDYVSNTLGFTDPVLDFINLERQRFHIAKKLFSQKWNFFYYLISSYDFLLHKVGRGKNLEEILETKHVDEFFREIDASLAWFVERCKDVNFVLMSDHGFREYNQVFYINQWLEENGYLKLKKRRYKSLDELSPRMLFFAKEASEMDSFIARLLGKFGTSPNLYNLTGWIVRSLPWLMPGLTERRLGDWGLEIDEKRTKVYCATENFLFSELDKVRLQRLIDRLKNLKIPGSRDFVFSNVRPSSRVFSGPQKKLLPPVVLDWNKAQVDFSLWSDTVFRERKNMNHQSEGIILTFGPELNLIRGQKYSIEDLAPTFLKLFSIPIPKWMDGKPMNVNTKQ